MAEKIYSAIIKVPQGVEVGLVDNTINVKGSKGELKRSFINPRINLVKSNDLVTIKCRDDVKFSKYDKMFINTYRAHIRNMFDGVAKGYTAKLKICTGHFPMNVSLDGNGVVIKNFLGEKIPRKAQIISGVKVQIQGDEIIVNGIDKDSVGQTAARIEQATRITNRDRRVFQDGIYIVKKPGDDDE